MFKNHIFGMQNLAGLGAYASYLLRPCSWPRRWTLSPDVAMSLPVRCVWFAAIVLSVGFVLPARADSTVVFNEIMYHPATNEAALEWVELYNQMSVDMDISHWSLAGGIDYAFPEGTIVAGGGYLVVASSPAALMAATGLTNVIGPFAGRVSNSGETLQLLNNDLRAMDSITYGTDGEWPVAPDGSGVSLAKRNPAS